MAYATARCSAKLCQHEERSHNCSLWARSGALPLCNHPFYDRSRYERLFGNCTLCGLAARLHDSNAPDGQLPTIPTRDKQVQCEAEDSITTNAFLQARAEHDVAKERLEHCACVVRTAGPPVLPEWNASWSRSDSTALSDYSEAYKRALIFALQGFDGLCTPDGLRINVSVTRVFGAGVNNFVFAAHRTDAPPSSNDHDVVVRLRVGQLGPAVGTARAGRPPDFDVPSLPSRLARVPPFLLAQPKALVAAGTCVWPASKRRLLAMVLPRGAATQADVLASALHACRERGITSALGCQFDATWESLRSLHHLTHLQRFVLAEHVVQPGPKRGPREPGCGWLTFGVVADWEQAERFLGMAQRRNAKPLGAVGAAAEVLRGVRHGRNSQLCFDRHARLMVCDTDHVDRSLFTTSTMTVPGSTTFEGGVGWMSSRYDVTCAASNTLLRPLLPRFPGLSRLVDEIQARHDAIATRATGGVVQLSLACVAGWLHNAAPALLQAARQRDGNNNGTGCGGTAAGVDIRC